MRELCYRFFSSVFSFCKKKGYYWWKYKFYRLSIRDPACGLLRSDRKLKKCQWRHNVPTWCHRQISLEVFFVFLVKFRYWFKFHVNIITGSGVITISLTRNPEIGNTPVWVWPNIWRLGLLKNTKFGTNVYNKMLLNTAKCQIYSFFHFWFSKGKPTGGDSR